MIAATVTITDEVLGFAKTKNNKDVMEFMLNYGFRQGKIVEQDSAGYEAELHSASRLNDEEVIGKMYVTF